MRKQSAKGVQGGKLLFSPLRKGVFPTKARRTETYQEATAPVYSQKSQKTKNSAAKKLSGAVSYHIIASIKSPITFTALAAVFLE